MKLSLIFCALVLLSCGSQQKNEHMAAQGSDSARIEEKISAFYAGLSQAYNGAPINTDSLFNANFAGNVRYVAPWGSTEPLDSTKARLRNALHHVTGFSYRIESMEVKSYTDAAFASFVLRQNYLVDGSPLDEYLPTTMVLERQAGDWKIVHVHRSTDFETMQQYAALQQKREMKKQGK